MWISAIACPGNILIASALSVHACYPGWDPLKQAERGFDFAWWVILAVFLISILMCASGFVVSYRNWLLTGPGRIRGGCDLVPVEEGRTRYLSVVGMSFSVLLFWVSVTGIVVLAIVPLCEG